jgi:peptide deformylase
LAAPQIGIDLQIVAFGFEKNSRYPHALPIPKTVLINPVITPLSDEVQEGWEGCLSVPGLRGMVPRHTHIRYQGYDQRGQLIDRTVSDFHARVVQHECDHLRGKTFPDACSRFYEIWLYRGTLSGAWLRLGHVKDLPKGEVRQSRQELLIVLFAQA